MVPMATIYKGEFPLSLRGLDWSSRQLRFLGLYQLSLTLNDCPGGSPYSNDINDKL